MAPRGGDDEERDSRVYGSLKHLTRRRILRILSNGEETFTDLLQKLEMDSGHLTYHLDGLGSLIEKTPSGSYRLTEQGSAAVHLMDTVNKEADAVEPLGRRPGRSIRVYGFAVLIIFTLAASIYFTAFVDNWTESIKGSETMIPAQGAFSYSTIIKYGAQGAIAVRNGSASFTLTAPITSLTYWEREVVTFTTIIEPRTHVIVAVYDTSEKLVEEHDVDNASSTPMYHTVKTPVEAEGVYQAVVRTLDSNSTRSGFLIPGFERRFLSRPFFYYGVAGLLLSVGVPMTLFLSQRRLRTHGSSK